MYRPHCASCLEEIAGHTPDRYEWLGNYCEKCLLKVNKNLRDAVSKERYEDALIAIRGDKSGIE